MYPNLTWNDVAQTGLKLEADLLSQPSECCDYRSWRQCPAGSSLDVMTLCFSSGGMNHTDVYHSLLMLCCEIYQMEPGRNHRNVRKYHHFNFFLLLSLFLEGTCYGSTWSNVCCVAQAGVEPVAILLPQCLQCWVTGMNHYSHPHFPSTLRDTGANFSALRA